MSVRYAIIWMCLVAILSVVPTLGAEQTLIIDGALNDHRIAGSYRAPIEFSRPITNLLEIETPNGTRFVTYTTPGIEVEERLIETNVSESTLGTSRVRSIRFTTEHSGIYRNVTYAIEEQIPTAAVLSDTPSERNATHTRFSFDLEREHEIIILESYDRIEQRSVIPTEDGVILLVSKPGSITEATLASDARSVMIATERAANLTITLPTDAGSFVMSALGTRAIIGEPVPGGAKFALPAGEYTIPIVTDAMLEPIEGGYRYEDPRGSITLEGTPDRIWITRTGTDLLIVEWDENRTNATFSMDGPQIVSSAHRDSLVPEGELQLESDRFPDASPAEGIRLELAIAQETDSCYTEGSANVCTQAPSTIGRERSAWKKQVVANAAATIQLESVESVTLNGEVIDCLSDARCDAQEKTLRVGRGTHEIGYALPSPIVFEQRQGAGKKVIVTSPYPYENVVVRRPLPYETTREDAFSLVWVRPGPDAELLETRSYELYDLDGNGAYDMIEWIVPHLSTQEFRIIPIRSVLEYEGNTLTRDLTSALERNDGIVATIEPSVELQVTFTEPIGAGDDITLVGDLSGDVSIEQNGVVIVQTPISGTREKIILPSGTAQSAVYTLTFSETVVLDLIIDPILIAYYDPTADIQAGWDCTGADCATGNFAVLDDGTRQPSVPDTTDYISQRSNAGGTDEHSVPAIIEPNVTYITLWSYVSTGSDFEMTIALENGGTPVATTTILPGASSAWVSTNWTVDAAIGTMSAVYTSTKNGPGGPQLGYVYAWYLEVGYEDLTPPNITFVAPTDNDSSIVGRDYVLVNVTASDATSGLAEIETRLYNRTSGALINTTNTSTSPHFTNFTNLSDGFYAFNATATDNVSNANTTQTRNVTVDTRFPLVWLEEPTPLNNSYLNATSIEVNASAYDLTLAELRIDLHNASTGALVNTTNSSTSPLNGTFGSLAEGAYLLNATATDGLGRVNTSETRTITIDRTVPTIAFVPNTPTNDTLRSVGNLPVNVSVTDVNPDTTVIRVYDAGGLVTSRTGAATRFELIALADGHYTYNATTTDLAGLSNATETRAITIDTTPPTLTVTSPLDSVTYIQTPILISFSATDATTAVDALWYFNGTANISYTGPTNLTIPNDNYTFIFYANDTAGNLAQQTISFELDTNAPDTDAPSIIVYSPIATTYAVSTITVNFTATDNVEVDALWYSDGTTNFSYTTPVGRTLTDGDYTFTFYANDTVNNTAQVSRSFTIDTTPPVASYEAPTDNDSAVLARNYLLVNVSVIETNIDLITVRLHNESGLMFTNTSTSSPFFLNQSGLPDGTYTFNATALDDAGFRDHLPNRTLILDTGAPIITFVSPTPANDTKIRTPYIDTNVSAIDPTLVNITTFIYDDVGSLVASNTSTASPFYDRFTSLSDGTYFFNATAYDAAGLFNSTETRNVTIDTTIPQVAYAAPTEANNQRLNRTYIEVNITFSDNDLAFGRIELLDQSGTIINQSNSTISPLFANFTNLTDGIYFFRGVAEDEAGNRNVTQTRTIEIRTSPVVTTFTSYYDPITDIQAGWACSGSGCANGDYDAVNDAIREPSIPNIGNFLSTTAGVGGPTEQDVGLVSETGIAQITLWAYVQTGSNFQMGISMENGGTSVATTTVPTGTSASWVSTTWSTPTGVSNISGVFTTTKVGGGGATIGYVYAWYVEVDYDDLVPPVLAYVPPTDAAAGSYARNYVLVNVTAVDALSGLDNVTTYLYTGADVFVTSDTKIFSPSYTNFSALASGAYKFNATGCDLANNCADLPTRLVNIDGIEPNISFVAPTDNHTALLNRSTIVANVTATDDFAGIDTITAYLYNFTSGSLVSSQAAAFSNTALYHEFTGLADGIYVLNATVNDTFGNVNVTENRRITIDTTPPNITIESPQNTTYTDEDVDLNYTVTDIRLDSCAYSLDGAAFIDLVGCANTTLVGLTTGAHDVRVRANDTLGNTAIVQVNFTISAEKPDLLIEDLFFIGSIEGQTVTINASIYNNASVPSDATNVSLLIERLEATDIFVSETNVSLPALSAGNRTNVTFSWTATLGLYRFTATADPGNVVDEANETNNARAENYAISSYSIRYGSLNFSKFLSNAALESYKDWSVSAPSGTIYYADADASFLPSNLAALNGTSDLEEADIALGMTYYNDSLNATWDADGNGIIDRFETFRISGSDIENVPSIASTPGSPFITGIFWDTADGGTQYDGTQDIVFATRINASTAGTYGTYDYEIALPVRLKNQLIGVDLVERTVEIE